MFKNLKLSFIVSSILYMALGIVLLIWPTTSLKVICYAFGGITLLYGLFRLAGYLSNRENSSVLQADTFIGILMLGLGIFLLLTPNTILSILPIVLGLFIIFNSIIKLQYAFELKADFYDKWWILLFLGIITAALGTLIAVNPFSSMEITVMAMGSVLVADGISNIFTVLFAGFIRWHLKRSGSDLAVAGAKMETVIDNTSSELTTQTEKSLLTDSTEDRSADPNLTADGTRIDETIIIEEIPLEDVKAQEEEV